MDPWDELDDILTQTFKDKLKLHNVEVGPVTIKSSGAAAAKKPVSDAKLSSAVAPVPPSVNFFNFTAPGLVHNLMFGPITILQEGETESPIVESPIIESQTPQAEVQDPGLGSEPEIPVDQIQVDELPDDNEMPIDQIQVDELPDDALPGIGAGNGEEMPNVSGPATATFTLNFDQEMPGKAIKTLLAQAASRMEREIDENQIKVIPEQIDADTSAELTLSKNWTVEMPVSAETAKTLTEKWSSGFNEKAYFPVAGGVGGQIASQTQWQAIMAIIASLLGIIAYVWIRFQNVAFGLAAVVALIHDVLIVLGAIALSHYVAGALGFILIEDFKISLPVIAALLTIIGYSLNDTIVVFDRIREVRGKRTEMTEEIINSSISQTLSRTILTSLTTFMVVVILYWFGGDAIHGFAFALVIGVVVGTYSSIFIASPTLLWLMNRGFSPEYDEHGNPIRKIA